VLVFTDKAKERGGAKDKKSFDSKKNYGLSVVLSNLKYEYEYTSYKNIDKYDYVLASLTSYYDIYNLVKVVPKEKKCKVIVGGQAVLNIRGYIDIIDFAWFGRCDGEEINYPIDGRTHSSLWSKKDDPLFEKEYVYNEGTLRETGETVFGEKETHIGCRQKCYFCQYSWVNKHKTIGKSESYQDAYTTKEDFFQCVDWKNIRVLTALDGMTEYTRKKINKPLTIETLEKKILETNEIKTEKNITAKIYSVIGFPWEDKNEISKCDLIGILEKNKKNFLHQSF